MNGNQPLCGHDPPQPETCLCCCLNGAVPADDPDIKYAFQLKLSCTHLGKVLDFMGRACPMVHIHECDIYQRVTLLQCQSCKDYELDGAAAD